MPTLPAAARLLSVSLLLVALVPGASAQSARVDLLNTRGGPPLPQAGAVVISETLDEVQYQRPGTDRPDTRPTSQVVHIEYGPGSKAFEEARSALQRGDLLNAINLFAAASSETEPGWVGPHALLALADAQSRAGRNDDARTTIGRFLSEHPQHRLTPEALLASAHYAAVAKDLAAASSAVQQVIELARSGKITPDWAVRAQVEQGQNLLDAGASAAEAGAAFTAAQTEARDALTRLDQRTDLAPTIERLVLRARSGAGTALLAAGDLAAARSYFETLARDGQGDLAILAAAQNGLAEADLRDPGKARLKDAQLGFARVAVTGAGAPDEHARALYMLGRCCQLLGEAGLEKNAAAKAQQYFAEVQKRYPGSPWARQAQNSLP